MPLVSSGVENGNLRELAMARMRDFGLTCRDVRSREVGLHEIHNRVRVRHPPPYLPCSLPSTRRERARN